MYTNFQFGNQEIGLCMLNIWKFRYTISNVNSEVLGLLQLSLLAVLALVDSKTYSFDIEGNQLASKAIKRCYSRKFTDIENGIVSGCKSQTVSGIVWD